MVNLENGQILSLTLTSTRCSANLWSITKVCSKIYKQYRLKEGVEDVLKKKLNLKWKLKWISKQWLYRIKFMSAYPAANKHSVLMWLILHQGVWTGSKAAKVGISDGVCQRCKAATEDIPHLFYNCKCNTHLIQIMNALCMQLYSKHISAHDLLLGNSKGLDIPLWNVWRGIILLFIWCSRNQIIFSKSAPPSVNSLKQDMCRAANQMCNAAKEAPSSDSPTSQIQKMYKWQQWKQKVPRYYSASRFKMRDFISLML